MKLLVCGDRNWCDRVAVEQRIIALNPEVIIHGCARGADTMAGSVAGQLAITIEAFPAQWDIYGRAAGPIRNKQMLDEGQPDYVLAFHDSIEQSKGTADMIRRATKAGITVEVWTH